MEDTTETRIRQSIQNDTVDNKFGFERLKGNVEKVAWLLNMHVTEVLDEDKRLISAVDFYFLEEDGNRFRATLAYRPYFYILPKQSHEKELSLFLSKKYASYLASVELVSKEDLDLPNHLVGLKQKYLKLSFVSMNDLMRVRKDILPAVKKNREREKSNTVYADMLKQSYIAPEADMHKMTGKKNTEHFENIIDIREYDVPYHMRVAIDKNICAAVWYSIKLSAGHDFEPEILRRPDIIESPDCIVLAYDIETTKLPLKFPDHDTDQIMMISYMIDAEGFLITNREIVSSDVNDFEYTPNPEFEGVFTVFNEPNEMSLIQRFFDHIMDIKPHIFATYNGDFFDWPFVEARAQVYGLSMFTEIGFSTVRDGIYSSRPCIHMDCFNWVKRDSYLPVGSQNLKAVAKAKLRYNPVELDPEDMCLMAAEQPQILSNYSVSDAVATYYLYMKYVHPFIFAMCTIIPMEPDEVLRKGSGTLCEALLMVEAFRANVIFPNRQETILNKMTDDGHVLDEETYVGGHVEALESGVFRSDITSRFKLDPDAFQHLIDGVESTLRHALEEEQRIPLDKVLNFDEIAEEIKSQLIILRDNPLRNEFPVIYHLDVAAMYPNIILTNRLQPSAMVDEVVCAACDFNKPGAKCQRQMEWTWRGEVIPASRAEFHRIQQQLEMEKFPSFLPGGPLRAFHQLTKDERAQFEKKRITDYSRKVYKKAHITRVEIRTQTICQQENSFYVDTVKAFRDRRYDYKALNKTAKREVEEAVAEGDATSIKSAKSREVLYDSLQLAHKCILNSFYGYVMRRGARWHSMEMAGLVCHTGSNIIKKAREIIEKVGRPLELDTDGIWCILPSSFPENFVIRTNLEKKQKINISYPNAVLNQMVKEEFTNPQYHELVNGETLEYKIQSENSILFEVDGPYLAMILPASKEEGKKLKKRYAVFNKDKSLAELKGFEVKRRGELQLIKIFQSSVFNAFLEGNTLETCYESVAKVADYWLDVLYSKAQDMPDTELFQLISENRNMSRKLEDYGKQKSTSISTAKRLAEFLGDQMVKDAGLSCRFIISRKPEGSPVTERAIPLVIFQAEVSVKKHYLRRWLKDNSLLDFDIRTILDWDYYIERLGGTIQKIITIPAALQGVSNPVPRVAHPDWLHKRMLEKTDVLKQRKINELFKPVSKIIPTIFRSTTANGDTEDSPQSPAVIDIEDAAGGSKSRISRIVVNSKRRKRLRSAEPEWDYMKPWLEVLGPPPDKGRTKDDMTTWLKFHKKKWEFQKKQKEDSTKRLRLDEVSNDLHQSTAADIIARRSGPVTIGGFLRRSQQTLLNTPWQILQIAESGTHGVFRVWVLVGQDLHQLKLNVPRIFYINYKEPTPMEIGLDDVGNPVGLMRKCTRTLPRSHPILHLFEYTLPEIIYRHSQHVIATVTAAPHVEGTYETQVPLDFRAIVQLGCVCSVDRQAARKIREVTDTFELNQLNFCNIGPDFPYVDLSVLKYVFLYQHKSGSKNFVGLIFPMSSRGTLYVVDTVRSNQLPQNLTTLYNQHRNERLKKAGGEESLPEADCQFEVVFETKLSNTYRHIQRQLQSYKDERKGPTVLCIQSLLTFQMWNSYVPATTDYPMIPIHIYDSDNAYSVLDWQRVATRIMFTHFFRLRQVLEAIVNQCRYLQIPIGNMNSDPMLFGCDVLYARSLMKQGFSLWCSATERPDLGGKEADDNRLITDFDESNSLVVNNPGSYQSVCIELEIDGLAVDTLLQAPHVHDIEGTAASIAFDNLPQASLEEMMGNTPGPTLANYDETALCSGAFRVLRSMVASWLKDVSMHRNLMADYQLVHFYRWLRSSHALLYDPALKKSLHNLMKKLFIQFLSEFIRLGATVVYGDFSKLIICTKKNHIGDALSYVDFVTASIKNRELFHGIDVRVKQSWECLMWLDLTNYGGIKGRMSRTLPEKHTRKKVGKRRSSNDNNDLSNDDEDDESDEMEVLNLSDEEDELEVDMHWRLVNYLPDVGNCKINFGTAIASYITAIHQHLRGELDGFEAGQTPVLRRKSTQTPRRAHTNPIAMNTVQYAKQLIRGEFSQKLFQIIQKLNKKYPSPTTEDENQSGVYKGMLTYKPGKPALEFIKTIHRVLSLDPNIEDEVHKLRRNLMRLIGVGEFSNEAQFVDPCLSVLVPEVICKFCILCRDIDLTKDEYVRMENDLPVWFCPVCKTDYETSEIEQTLVETLNRKVMAFVLQDLHCVKCKQIKQDNMQLVCTCAGKLQTIINVGQFTSRLEAYKGLALHFGMPLFLQNVEWILKMNSPSGNIKH